MRTATISARIAELPAQPGRGEDRIRVGWNAVAVLDGASGTDCGVSVSDYVDVLADRLITILDNDPVVSLDRAVSESIELTASALNLSPGSSPSSTVSIVRRGSTSVDTLVLGDSPIYVAHSGGIDCLRDDRLAQYPRRAAPCYSNGSLLATDTTTGTGSSCVSYRVRKRRIGTSLVGTGSPKPSRRPA